MMSWSSGVTCGDVSTKLTMSGSFFFSALAMISSSLRLPVTLGLSSIDTSIFTLLPSGSTSVVGLSTAGSMLEELQSGKGLKVSVR